jgi:hypothetical protein
MSVAPLLVGLNACGPARTSDPAVAPQATTSSSAKLGDISKVDLPTAKNALPLPEEAVPIVSVIGGKIRRDGEVVGDASTIAKEGRLQRVDGLWESLKAAREEWKNANPGKPFPGVALFAFDRTAPAVVVKSVFQTAAFAGFPNAQFAVRGGDGTVMRLPVDAIVPGPALASPPEPGARLLVVVRPSKHVLAWRTDGAVVSTTDVASVRDLPERVKKEWAEHAVHRESSDKSFDQAVLYVGDDVDYAGLVAVVDSIYATTRDFLVAGAKERVPAMNVNLAMATEMGKGSGDPLAANGRLPPETIQRVVRESFGRFRACYERGLARNKSLAGAVRVRFVIDTTGKVGEVGDAGESTLDDPETVKCIVRELGTLSFPRPQGGVVTVVYPLVFGPGDSAASDEPQPGGGIGLGRP